MNPLENNTVIARSPERTKRIERRRSNLNKNTVIPDWKPQRGAPDQESHQKITGSSLSLLLSLLRINLKNLAIYRANFHISFIASATWIFAYIILIEVIYGNVSSVAGWNKGEMLTIMAFYYLFQHIGNIFYRDNFENFGEMMRRGEIDFALTKPAPITLLIFFRKIRLDYLAALVVNIFFFLYAFNELKNPISIAHFLLGIGYTLVAVVFVYYFLLLITSLMFWFQKSEELGTIIWNLLQVGRYPRGIYQGFAKTVFVFLIPLALVAAIPAEITLSLGSWHMPLYFLGITVLFGIGSRTLFRYGLSKYTSAG